MIKAPKKKNIIISQDSPSLYLSRCHGHRKQYFQQYRFTWFTKQISKSYFLNKKYYICNKQQLIRTDVVVVESI